VKEGKACYLLSTQLCLLPYRCGYQIIGSEIEGACTSPITRMTSSQQNSRYLNKKAAVPSEYEVPGDERGYHSRLDHAVGPVN